MGNVSTSVGRVLAVAGIVLLALTTGMFPATGPRDAAAQDYEAMMPNTLQHEAHKLHQAYLEAIHEVNAAQSERLARQAAGAAEADLHALDQKIAGLVSKAEKLKVDADYLDELYISKMREYKSK
jgi:hypothetical protein